MQKINQNLDSYIVVTKDGNSYFDDYGSARLHASKISASDYIVTIYTADYTQQETVIGNLPRRVRRSKMRVF